MSTCRDFKTSQGRRFWIDQTCELSNLPLPASKELLAIVENWAQRRNNDDDLMVLETGVPETLQERRTALISAAVTGKIDVRGWKPPVSDAVAEVA
jgi:type I restriction enzyme S subunit